MTPTETLPAIRTDYAPVRAEDFMPLMTVEKAVERKGMVNQFIAKVLKEDEDYGKMPGGQVKKVLLKPGAEKLCSIFGLSPKYVKEVVVEDWTGAQHGGEPLFSYEYRCQLWRGDRFMGEAIGSCNSWESKYRYRWVQEDAAKERPDFEKLPKRGGMMVKFEPVFAIDRKETEGKYGKPKEYWDSWDQAILTKTAKFTKKMLGKKEYGGWEMQVDTVQYRVPNPDIADVINTCQKMAQKRALVAAVLVVTNCSDAFTQDVEDFTEQDHGETHEPTQNAPQQKTPADSKASEPRAIPKALQQVWKDMDKDLSCVVQSYAHFEGEFIRKAGDAGLKQYQAFADAFHVKYPNGATKEAHREMLLNLWDALQAIEPPVEVKS